MWTNRAEDQGVQLWLEIFDYLPECKDFYATKGLCFCREYGMLSGAFVCYAIRAILTK